MLRTASQWDGDTCFVGFATKRLFLWKRIGGAYSLGDTTTFNYCHYEPMLRTASQREGIFVAKEELTAAVPAERYHLVYVLF
ncbi:MAG: hypothetical protein GC192_22445 [Bacteroidetes bacterium]|nr:hypothetical protein [Bacteroidota bacterium]